MTGMSFSDLIRFGGYCDITDPNRGELSSLHSFTSCCICFALGSEKHKSITLILNKAYSEEEEGGVERLTPPPKTGCHTQRCKGRNMSPLNMKISTMPHL